MSGKLRTRRYFLKVAGATTLGLVVASCAPKPTATPVPPTPGPKATVEPTKAPEGKKKISISQVGGTSQEGSDKHYRLKMLREAFPDIDIENRWMGYGAYVEKMPLMVASGDIADLQFCNALNDIPLMTEAKIIAETGPLLEKVGKDILATTVKEAWESTIYDNKQYAVCHNMYDLNFWGIYYRKDWLDKVGITKVPETIDEYGEALKAFTDKDPDGNGKKDTWGRSPMNSLKFDDDVYHAFGAAVGHHANGFWRKRGNQLALDWVQPGLKEGVAWFAEMYKAGALEPEGITAPIDVWLSKWVGGLVGSQYAGYSWLDSQQLALRKIDPKATIVPGPAVKGPHGDQGFTGEGWPWCYVLSVKCKYPEDAVGMINWVCTPETLAKLVCIGELGITNKGLNDKGWCDEYSPEEIAAMGEEWTNRSKEVADRGFWLPTDVVPSILAHMPADMKAHFEGIIAKRMSPAAVEGMNFANKYMRLSAKKRPAPSEKNYWPNLQTRFLEFLTQGATGAIEIEQGWKDWLDFFEKNGGPKLTEEVNAM